jgi:hypothetical protein
MRYSQGGGVRPPRSDAPLGGPMTFRVYQAQFDKDTKRAYVEFRRIDRDGGDQLVVAVFTFHSKERLSKQQIREEVVRKARHVLKERYWPRDREAYRVSWRSVDK